MRGLSIHVTAAVKMLSANVTGALFKFSLSYLFLKDSQRLETF